MKDIMYNTAFRYNCSISQHRYWLRVVFGPWGRHTESEVLQRLHHCLQQRWRLRAWNQINVDITTCEATGGLQVNNKVQDALWREMLPGVLWPLENMTAILWSRTSIYKSLQEKEKSWNRTSTRTLRKTNSQRINQYQGFHVIQRELLDYTKGLKELLVEYLIFSSLIPPSSSNIEDETLRQQSNKDQDFFEMSQTDYLHRESQKSPYMDWE